MGFDALAFFAGAAPAFVEAGATTFAERRSQQLEREAQEQAREDRQEAQKSQDRMMGLLAMSMSNPGFMSTPAGLDAMSEVLGIDIPQALRPVVPAQPLRGFETPGLIREGNRIDPGIQQLQGSRAAGAPPVRNLPVVDGINTSARVEPGSPLRSSAAFRQFQRNPGRIGPPNIPATRRGQPSGPAKEFTGFDANGQPIFRPLNNRSTANFNTILNPLGSRR